MPQNVKVLHGPYGDAWAVKVDLGEGCYGKLSGWHRAKDEADAMEEARKELAFWKVDEDDAVFDRVTPPLTVPQAGSNDEDESGLTTDGVYVADGVEIPFCGACPVQGSGELDGCEVYYRARGSGWSLDVELSDNETWTYSEHAYAWPDGGWLHRDESEKNIEKAVSVFRARFGPQEDKTLMEAGREELRAGFERMKGESKNP